MCIEHIAKTQRFKHFSIKSLPAPLPSQRSHLAKHTEDRHTRDMK